ncbi:hypothetical protein NC651_000144 [Populus alba x Populus x berolinensis]|nr:hypothetical protein NC651_000144 [Populus alba x Populus x berolinensis]
MEMPACFSRGNKNDHLGLCCAWGGTTTPAFVKGSEEICQSCPFAMR